MSWIIEITKGPGKFWAGILARAATVFKPSDLNCDVGMELAIDLSFVFVKKLLIVAESLLFAICIKIDIVYSKI